MMGLRHFFFILDLLGPKGSQNGPKLKTFADPSCDQSKFAREGHLANEENFTSKFDQYLSINKVAALLDYAPKAWFGMNAKYFKLKYSGAFDDKNA